MSTRAAEQFDTVRTEGGLLPPGLLARVAAGDQTLPALTPEGYHLTPGERFGEVINRSWSRLVGAWASFSDALSHLNEGDAGTGLTRDRWLLVLYAELGYGRLPLSGTIEVGGETYPVSHTWGAVPIHLVGAGVDLDRRTPGVAGAARLSPHSLVQDLLNRDDERLWGFVSNGLRLRILRDNLSLTRQAFVEFDLNAMMDGEVYSDFVVLWLLAHQSRFEGTDPENYWIERWSIEARAQGTRALDHLRDGVESAITALGNGFLRHTYNVDLRKSLQDGGIPAIDYYRQLLRVVYRLLFLLVAEERDLLLAPDTTTEASRRYREYYSVRRLRDLAERRRGSAHEDLWAQVQTVVALLGQPEGCPDLGLPGLGGFLFSERATPDLDACRIANTDVLACLRALSGRDDAGYRQRHDYRNLGVEELGSVYESLLELHPEINVPAQTFVLSHGGHERRATGSHYTPPKILKQVLDFALEPAIERALTAPNREAALLDLRVLDPAAGSGHFLIAAAHRIARALASVRTDELEPTPAAVRTALREVVAKCIYGVDLNPMAVELCRVALWLETLEPGKPLGFIDHHVRVGNSLIGVPLGTTVARNRAAADAAHEALAAKVAQLVEELRSAPATGGKAGEITKELRRARRELESEVYDSWAEAIPDAAFKAVGGDDTAVARRAITSNRRGRQSGQLLLGNVDLRISEELAAEFTRLREAPQNTFAEITVLAELFDETRRRQDYLNLVALANTWTSAFFWPLVADAPEPPTQEWFATMKENPAALPRETVDLVEEISEHRRFFQFESAFPEVFVADRGGFDVVIGNPPYLGGVKISSSLGHKVLNFLKAETPESGGATDLAAYFLRRGFDLLCAEGDLGFITTNSIAEGDTRAASLGPITEVWGGQIVHAIRSAEWEGAANVTVAVLHLRKGAWEGSRTLDGVSVEYISPALTNDASFTEVATLSENSGRSFQGMITWGTGFVLESDEASRLISKEPAADQVVVPYWTADDITSRPDVTPSRYVIDFADMSYEEASAFPGPLDILRERVKPKRDEVRRARARTYWWRFGETRPGLRRATKDLARVIVMPRHSLYGLPVIVANNGVFSEATVVFAYEDYGHFAFLSSAVHWLWAMARGSSMRNAGLRYTPTDCFETLPLPDLSEESAVAGLALHEFRSASMLRSGEGLTATYNRYADPLENSTDIANLRALHGRVDEAIAASYGWTDLDLGHEFRETRFGLRFAVSERTEREIMARLTAMNRDQTT